jgi:hypothetical protein
MASPAALGGKRYKEKEREDEEERHEIGTFFIVSSILLFL